jgi:hypothetical protein
MPLYRRVVWHSGPEIPPHKVYVPFVCPDDVRGCRLLGKPRMNFRRTVRITFDRLSDSFRVDELIGEWVSAHVTDWTCEEDAEIEAAIYAAARGLLVSRMDVTL